MTASSCAEIIAQAGEFVLGLLGGDEQAAVLAHLTACPDCRREVDDLSRAADAIAQAAPAEEPPAGFENRVLARLPLGRTRSTTGKWLLAVAAIAAVVALAAALLVNVGRDQGGDQVRTAAMVAPDRTHVGRVLVTGHPTEVVVSLPGWERGHAVERYRLRVRLTGGRTFELGPAELRNGYGGFSAGSNVTVGDIVRIDMVDEAGHAACSATLT